MKYELIREVDCNCRDKSGKKVVAYPTTGQRDKWKATELGLCPFCDTEYRVKKEIKKKFNDRGGLISETIE